MEDSSIVSLIVVGFWSCVFAFWHGSIWEKNHPDKLGFKWGYFLIYSMLISGVCGSVYFTWIGIDEVEVGLLIMGIVLFVMSFGIAYFCFGRQRWALIILTLLSFNPIVILINLIYLKNRWSEFQSESSIEFNGPSMGNFKIMTRDVRIAIFIAIAWVFCVPSFVFLFRPYGSYMREADMSHMIGVVLLPAAMGLALFFIYRQFVKLPDRAIRS